MQTAGLNIFWIIFRVIKFYAYYSDLVSHESSCVAWDFVWEMSAPNTIDAWCHQNRRWCLTTSRIDGFLYFIEKMKLWLLWVWFRWIYVRWKCVWFHHLSFHLRKQQQTREKVQFPMEVWKKKKYGKLWLFRSEIFCVFASFGCHGNFNLSDSWAGAERNRENDELQFKVILICAWRSW